MSALWDIVGYAYCADTYCADCIGARLTPNGHNRVTAQSAEALLDALAAGAGVDRENEATFDSGDFPKVLFRDQAEGRCGRCGVVLE